MDRRVSRFADKDGGGALQPRKILSSFSAPPRGQGVTCFCKMSRLWNPPGRLSTGGLLFIAISAGGWNDGNNPADVAYSLNRPVFKVLVAVKVKYNPLVCFLGKEAKNLPLEKNFPLFL